MEENKDIITVDKVRKVLSKYFKKSGTLKLLNIGSKGGLCSEYSWIQDLGREVEHFELDYDLDYVKNTEHSFFGDICSCPQIADNSFDIVYIYNVLEHTQEPWEAAKECIRICKSGGVIISSSPFSWYYHKHPVDFWRFTHEGLQRLFERQGNVEPIILGFKDILWASKKGKSVPAPKNKGIQSIYVGKKK